MGQREMDMGKLVKGAEIKWDKREKKREMKSEKCKSDKTEMLSEKGNKRE